MEQSQHTALGLQSTDSLIRSREPSQAPARQPDDPPLLTCFYSDVGWDEMQVGLRQHLADDLRGQFLERHPITCSSAQRRGERRAKRVRSTAKLCGPACMLEHYPISIRVHEGLALLVPIWVERLNRLVA